MAKHRPSQQWASLVRRYEDSHLTQDEFCRRHDLALSTFAYQLRRHRANKGERGGSLPAPQVLEVKVAQPEAATVPAPGPLAEGVIIEIAGLANAEVRICCQAGQVGEILRQISSLHRS